MIFRNEYNFLSNFYSCLVVIDGITYPSVENAYQAQKTLNLTIRKLFAKLTASEAKKLGAKLKFRPDWEHIKLFLMLRILKEKFNNEHPQLQEKLRNTKDLILIETNYWHDNYWGNCTCSKCEQIEGQNNLGKLLMQIRNELTHI